jgi:hypothetical protein
MTSGDKDKTMTSTKSIHVKETGLPRQKRVSSASNSTSSSSSSSMRKNKCHGTHKRPPPSDDEDYVDDDEDDESEVDDESDTESLTSTEALSRDPLYFVLSRLFISKNGKNIADLLEEISTKLSKRSS